MTNLIRIDHEQSLFFFRFSEGSARARSCLFHLAPSATRVVIYVSRAFYSTDQEKRQTFYYSNMAYNGARSLRSLPFPFHLFSLTPAMQATFNLAV